MEDSKEIKVENHSYQCPSCGGNMTFDPLKYSLYCEYCETSIDLQAIKSSEEYDFSLGLAEDQKWDNENIVFHCEYCGADNVKEKGSLSNNCPFCGSDSIIALDEIPGIKPHRVIPFKITKNESLNRFHKSIKKKLFVPNEIKKNFPETKLNGIYIPSWTFDASASAYYEGRLGKRYTRTVGSGKNRRTVTEIRWFRISGSKNFIFDDTLVISSKTLKDKQVEPVAPFNTNDAIVYQDEYLSGFSAEHYSVSLNDGWKLAQDKNLSVMRRGILNDYYYDVVDYLKIRPVYSNIKYKYVLLPVWFSNYQYHKKQYYFIVNGETGKINGKYPVSPLKVTILVLIILILLGLFLFLCYENGDNYYDYLKLLK